MDLPCTRLDQRKRSASSLFSRRTIYGAPATHLIAVVSLEVTRLRIHVVTASGHPKRLPSARPRGKDVSLDLVPAPTPTPSSGLGRPRPRPRRRGALVAGHPRRGGARGRLDGGAHLRPRGQSVRGRRLVGATVPGVCGAKPREVALGRRSPRGWLRSGPGGSGGDVPETCCLQQ